MPGADVFRHQRRAGLSARDIRLSADGVRFCALEESGLERVFLGLPGQFSVYNALAAIACGRLLGLSLRECAVRWPRPGGQRPCGAGTYGRGL